MVIGDHIAVAGQDKAGTGGRALLGAVNTFGNDGRGDGHHAVHIPGIHLGRSHTVCRCRNAGKTMVGGVLHLLLQIMQLLLHAGNQSLLLIGQLFPAVVHNTGGDTTACSHQGNHQDGSQSLFPEAAELTLLLHLFYLGNRLGLRLEGIAGGIFLPDRLIGFIRGIGIGRFLPATATAAIGSRLHHRFRNYFFLQNFFRNDFLRANRFCFHRNNLFRRNAFFFRSLRGQFIFFMVFHSIPPLGFSLGIHHMNRI